jgi:bifunctional ADP-heptose synthase (sugar kinase/adenylyltransferase)
VRRAADKIATGERARQIVDGWRAAGDTVVVAHGGFDLIEAAHVRALSSVKGDSARLVVEVAGDRSLGTAPVLGESERALLAAALRIVDLVIVVSAKSPNAVDVEPEPRTGLSARLRAAHGHR